MMQTIPGLFSTPTEINEKVWGEANLWPAPLGQKETSTEGQTSLKNNSTHARTSVFISPPQPLPHIDNWIGSFYIALFKSRNYGNYEYKYIHILDLIEIIFCVKNSANK